MINWKWNINSTYENTNPSYSTLNCPNLYCPHKLRQFSFCYTIKGWLFLLSVFTGLFRRMSCFIIHLFYWENWLSLIIDQWIFISRSIFLVNLVIIRTELLIPQFLQRKILITMKYFCSFCRKMNTKKINIIEYQVKIWKKHKFFCNISRFFVICK